MKLSQTLLPLLCALSLPATCPAQTASSVCLPLAQARVISTSLRKYEVLKPLAYQLLLVKDSLGQANARLHQVIVLQDTAYADLGRTVYYRSVLLADQTAKTQQWKLKAKERWWVNAGLTLLLVGVTGLAITK